MLANSRLIFAFGGVLISLYLLKKKLKKERPVCLLGEDCHRILESRYGRIFHLPNEFWGSLFFLTILAIQILLPLPFLHLFAFWLSLIASLVAVLLSFIQIFILKGFCTWCILANLLTILIFLTYL